MRFITLLFAALLVASTVFAENGKIAGKISDKTYGEAVIGASVSVQGMSIGTVTDVDGNFTISVPTGEYVIEVKYLGYQPKNIEGVAVKANQTTTVSVVMEESKSTEMEEVVVTARLERETVNALYIQQRNNVSLSSGISADIIQRSPDKNTGEVLKRVSGASIQNGKYVIIRGLNDRYNMAMLNNALMPSTEPDRKAFSFDIVPSNVIDNIIINKTATPDMPGDFAGGVVKVLTKDVPEKDFITIGLTGGFNTQTTFKDFTTTPSGGGTAFGFPAQDHMLSESWGATPNEYGQKTNAEQVAAFKELPANSYQTTTTSAMPNTSLQLSAGKSLSFKNGDKFGVIAALSTSNSRTTLTDYQRGKYLNNGLIHTLSSEQQYKQAANSAALLNLAYTTGKSRISFKNLYNKLYDQTYIDRLGHSTSSDQQNPLYATIPQERSIMNNQLEGSHAIGTRNVKVEWNLNYANMRSNQNDYRTVEYSRNITTTPTGEFEGADTSLYRLVDRNSRRFFSTQTDDNYGGNLNVTYPFEIAGYKQTVKAGYLGLIKERVFNARFFQYELFDITRQDLPWLPIDQIFAAENIGRSGFILSEKTAPTDRYDAGATMHAAYVMFDNIIAEKLRVIWGARYESYTQTLLAKDRAGTLIDQSTPFNDILPSVNITYDVNEKQKVRFAASQTVNRPEFREVAPFSFTDYENIWSLVGNPTLVRANITNLDLRYEIYPNAGEVLSIGAFYKHFKNPIEAVLNSQANLDFLLFGYANAPSAYTAGVELEVRKNLGFISESSTWAKNFTAGANFTYIYSRVDASKILGTIPIIGTKADRPLQGQSPYIINVSLMYNAPKSGWSASALYNRIGHRIAYVGSATIPTTWENGRNIVDLQLGKTVLKGKGEFKLTVSDLLNSATVLYWNTDDKDAYKKGDDINGKINDLPFQKYKSGTGVSVGFRYTIGK